MKIPWLAIALLTLTALKTQGQVAGGFTVTERGADYRVLQKTTIENGTNRVHRYVTMATGMNYTNSSGQLVEAEEQITLLPAGGAAAEQGRHRVYFPADIYNGVLEVVTPDGRHLRSRPLCVSYDDGSNTVFVAQLKHSIGWLTRSNQVTYRDAFTAFNADLVCTYRRGGFECDLVFRQQPPKPDQYGLDNSFSTLQLVTEFFNTADPEQIPAQTDDWFGLQDNTLKFGSLTMTHGRAFAIGTTNSPPSAINSSAVFKRWLHQQGRTFLIEEVPLIYLADDLDALPLTTSATPKTSDAKSQTRFASRHREFPPAHGFEAETNRMQIAAIDLNQQPGVVLDYTAIDSGPTDFTFQAGSTYFVNGGVNFSGTTTFEGGTIIKANADVWSGISAINIDENDAIVCPVDPSQPAVFTSINDDSIGESIDGSSGSPNFSDVNTFLYFDCPDPVIRNLRFRYGCRCVNDWNYTWNSHNLDAWDCQFLDVDIAIEVENCSVGLHNVLIREVDDDNPIYIDDSGELVAENVTLDSSLPLGSLSGGGIHETNCLSAYSSGNLYHVSINDGPGTESHTPTFNSSGWADYYLAISSPYRNAGTTNISPDLLAEFQTMTTYAAQDGGYPRYQPAGPWLPLSRQRRFRLRRPAGLVGMEVFREFRPTKQWRLRQ